MFKLPTIFEVTKKIILEKKENYFFLVLPKKKIKKIILEKTFGQFSFKTPSHPQPLIIKNNYCNVALEERKGDDGCTKNAQVPRKGGSNGNGKGEGLSFGK